MSVAVSVEFSCVPKLRIRPPIVDLQRPEYSAEQSTYNVKTTMGKVEVF